MLGFILHLLVAIITGIIRLGAYLITALITLVMTLMLTAKREAGKVKAELPGIKEQIRADLDNAKSQMAAATQTNPDSEPDSEEASLTPATSAV